MSVEVPADAVPRPDWRDSLALAADLALLGIVVFLACLPIVTAGAALATASVAADHACRYRSLPALGSLLATFRRAIVPGLGATAVLVAAGAVLAVDVRAVSAGRVPGGAPMLVSTVVVAVVALAVGALTLVHVGRTNARGWVAAGRLAASTLWQRPSLAGALVPVVALPAVLASAIPVTAPLLLGMTVFALHAVVRRLQDS